MTKMFTRAGRAAILDRNAFTEAFFDDEAMADGAIVVALVGAATYGGWIILGSASFSVTGLFSILIASVASWLILGFATWFAATRLFGSSNRAPTLLAMHGLAVLPLLLEIFGGLVSAAGLVWYLVVLVIGTREGADLPTNKSVAAVLIGFAAAMLIRAIIRVPFAVFAMSLG